MPLSICSTHHAQFKYVKIFEKFCLIIRNKAILSELCMEFEKKTVFILCVNSFITLFFFEIKNIALCDEPSLFFIKFFV